MQIQLERLWTLGAKIGGGGFGEVFEASAVDCGRAVAKLVPKEDGAQRELLFVDLGGARNVIPILDSGETTSHYVLIMPYADKSLRRHLADTDRPRPRPAAILQRLQRISEPPRTGGLAKLQEAHQNEVMRRAEHARSESRLRSEQERRSELFDAAKTQLDQILESLRTAIVAVAPSVRDLSDIAGMRMGLGNAEMQSSPVARTNMEPWEGYDQPAFTVVGHSSIGIRIPPDRHQYEGRSHSLWFCDAVEKDNFQWFETAFMISPIIPRRSSQNPFALSPGKAVAQALSGVLGRFQVAWHPFH